MCGELGDKHLNRVWRRALEVNLARRALRSEWILIITIIDNIITIIIFIITIIIITITIIIIITITIIIITIINIITSPVPRTARGSAAETTARILYNNYITI